MYIQKTNWGTIEWINIDRFQKNKIGMNIGLVKLKVNSYMQSHIHYDSQFLYFLEGTGVCIVNEKKYIVKKGDLFTWPAGVVHEMENTGKEELVHIMVSNPNGGKISEKAINKNEFVNKKFKDENNLNLLKVSVDAIKTQFLGSVKYSYSIFDFNDKLIRRSKYMPEYCNYKCKNKLNDLKNCCMLEKEDKFYKTVDYHCRYGVKILSIPIIYKDEFLGYIQGGYFLDTVFNNEYYIYPESSIEGIRKLLINIVNTITNYCEFHDYNKELENKNILLTREKENKELLLEKVEKANNKILDMKINNHFLFNTLNSMASMALENNQWELYNSIINLARMFQYNQRRSFEFVKLKEEVEYVKSYLKLQKNRYKDKLEIEINVDKKTLDILVPFNFLQPIIENAFEHGFIQNEIKKLYINIYGNRGKCIIKITNNGNEIPNSKLKIINNEIKFGKIHGLSMIYNKLQNIYHESFYLYFGHKNNLTEVKILLPIKEVDKYD